VAKSAPKKITKKADKSPIKAAAKPAAKVAKAVVAKPAVKSAAKTISKPPIKPVVTAKASAKFARPTPIETVPPRAVPVTPVPTNGKPRKNQAGISPRELENFRDLLLAKRREIVGDMSQMEREALRSAGGSNLSNLPLHMADMGTDNYEQEFTLGLVEKDRQLLREIWAEIAPQARVPILHRGLVMTARREEAVAVLEAFLATEMGEGCRLLAAGELRRDHPHLAGEGLLAGLWSPHDLRVESRQAIPRLAAWLEARWGVTFLWGVAALAVETGKVSTTRGVIAARAVAVCPGDDLSALFPERVAAAGVTRCKLQMLRLADPGFRISAAVMSDLGLARYAGYAALPQAEALRACLAREQPRHLAEGVHLIVVQSADGSLVVGDSHHYAPTPDPFSRQSVDDLILDEFAQVFGRAASPVTERWTGTYASAGDRAVLVDTPMAGVRLAMVTTGAGASTGFALGEEIVADLMSGDFRTQGAMA